MAGARNDVELLLPCKIDELDRISGNADSEVRVLFLFGMLHSVNELFGAENIDVEMVRALIEIAVHDLNEVGFALLVVMTESCRADRLRI